MGKSSRNKRRTYQSPKKARAANNSLWYALAFVMLVGGALAVALSRSSGGVGTVGPLISRGDHWHAALGVDDCGTWVPNWQWPPGNVTAQNAAGAGSPARAGTGGLVYAGLHSHGDGLIHMEPATTEDEGKNATLGRYFKYGGWKLSSSSIDFVNVKRKTGDTCDGKPGVLRWAVNGKEMHSDPAKYKLLDGDAIELVFTTAGAKLPPKTQIPSYSALQDILHGGSGTASTMPNPNAPASTPTPSTGATATSSP
jgi:hypothetical protein